MPLLVTQRASSLGVTQYLQQQQQQHYWFSSEQKPLDFTMSKYKTSPSRSLLHPYHGNGEGETDDVPVTIKQEEQGN